MNSPRVLFILHPSSFILTFMTYQVIARKWRPQTFDEVTGQEPITRTLRNAIEHQRIHHAYLFSGARGVGKTTTARLLAKALNCHKSKGPTATPCRTDDPEACASCREISESRSIDVQEIDAASHTGVGDVRDTIIETIGFAPARDRYKIFVIDEVHMLSTSSFQRSAEDDGRTAAARSLHHGYHGEDTKFRKQSFRVASSLSFALSRPRRFLSACG